MRQTYCRNIFKTAALASVISGLTLSALNAQIRYELVVPEVSNDPIKHVSSYSNKINDNGETLLNRIQTFAIWKDGAITQIASGQTDYPAKFTSIRANSVNAYQEVVGSKTYLVSDELGDRFDTFPFYWDAENGIVDLHDVGQRSADGSGSTRLISINEEGLAIGSTLAFQDSRSLGQSAFTWSFEAERMDIAPLDGIEGFSFTSPKGINDDGTVVGIYRKFDTSADTYHERGFIFDSVNGSRDLSQIDADFFVTDHYTAREINAAGSFIGERDRTAYLYDVENGVGFNIASPLGSSHVSKAYAVNDHDVVAGITENRSPTGNQGYTPILWTRSTGTIDILPQIEKSLERVLPEGIAPESCIITPKSINNGGTISASLETASTFSREIVLKPTLDFRWHSQQPKTENGVMGVLYTHYKGEDSGAIPAVALGYEIGFECSSDMQNWCAISDKSPAARSSESEASIELFVPFSECIFVRPVLRNL
ncbi:hypothetical protein [Pelagicoccus sp. SDUM812002]|uniref:hypothetical protein n=1 Tax=Pelagicoccus sp. SDUM812002 TaxID=3041266 RepID=UPI00280E5CDF|nr:hypothetical protein [Pelagicoccus sp. SDUM812002]MDQ8185123.1 hypothetical protein [Pelagicoccus sp. SDUM812002]